MTNAGVVAQAFQFVSDMKVGTEIDMKKACETELALSTSQAFNWRRSSKRERSEKDK